MILPIQPGQLQRPSPPEVKWGASGKRVFSNICLSHRMLYPKSSPGAYFIFLLLTGEAVFIFHDAELLTWSGICFNCSPDSALIFVAFRVTLPTPTAVEVLLN